MSNKAAWLTLGEMQDAVEGFYEFAGRRGMVDKSLAKEIADRLAEASMRKGLRANPPTGPKMHLRFDMYAATDSGESRHPQKVMLALGITYFDATPQSMGDQWWFWGCQGFPEVLPKYLEPLNLNPVECIGYGLSEEDAAKIIAFMEEK